MVNENLINLINKKPVELVQELKDYEVKKSPLSPAARAKVIKKYGGDYQSLRATINNPSYGPGVDGVDSPEVQKWCGKCGINREVGSGDAFCPKCGTSFGTISKVDKTMQQQVRDGMKEVRQYGGSFEYKIERKSDSSGAYSETESAKYSKN